MNMKNLIAVALSGSVLATSAAFADFEPRFYVGADAVYNHLNLDKKLSNDTKTFKKNKLGANFVLGGKFHEFFGAEAGYSFMQKVKGETKAATSFIAPVATKFNAKVNNMYLDLMGFYPVSQEVDLLASVGVGRMKVKFTNGVKTIADSKSSKSKTGLRARVGAQYKLDENFAARFMVGTQKGVKAMGVKSNTSAGLGVTYTF
jgi:opacity protein-like surface antigen